MLLQQITAINVTSLVKPKLWASELSILAYVKNVPHASRVYSKLNHWIMQF